MARKNNFKKVVECIKELIFDAFSFLLLFICKVKYTNLIFRPYHETKSCLQDFFYESRYFYMTSEFELTIILVHMWCLQEVKKNLDI